MTLFIKKFTDNHLLLGIYLLVFLLLISGVISVSGFTYIPQLLLYFGAFLIFYLLIFRLKNKVPFTIDKTRILEALKKNLSSEVLAIGSIVAVVLHLFMLQRFPALDAYHSLKLSEVVLIRRAITEDMPSWVNYMMSWNMKALIPFTLVLLFVKGNRKVYWVFYCIAVFYGFILMQKSFILLILMPLGIVALFQAKWLYFAKVVITSVVVVFTLSFIQNVTLRGGVNDIRVEYEKEPPSASGVLSRLFGGLKRRVMIIPGKMVVNWFELIPEKKPFLYGNGFKIYSKLSGGTYHDYARELYPYVYVENAKHGLVGSVNAASFMRGYSNFGNLGLIISALFLAFVLVIVESMFAGNLVFKCAFNAFPVLILSSTSLPTILVSGGWCLTILLFFIFKDQFFQKDNKFKKEGLDIV